MNVNDEILAALQKVANSHEPVRLINEYKGLPIVHPVTFLEVTSNSLLVKVHPQQAVCLHLEKFTFIRSEKLPFIVRANAESVDIPSCTARLKDILYGSDTIGGRMQIRVQPASTVSVSVSVRSRVLRGELADVSLVGVGMYALSAYMYNPVTLKRGTEVQVRAALTADGEITIPGVILYAKREGDTYRLGVRTEPDESTRAKLAAFIDHRSIELENELLALYTDYSSQGA